MGSNKAASTSPSPPPPVVCCMCGDHGLLAELFRCKACSFRSQHTYCTDRYPKAESYSTCNWCLRSQGATKSVDDHSNYASNYSTTSSGNGSNNVGVGSVPKIGRGVFSSHQNKPIKKQRFLRRSASDLGCRLPPPVEAPPSPSIARGRPKVRRYKLLEEVITIAST